MARPRAPLANDPGGMLAAIGSVGEHLLVGHRRGLGAEDLPAADGVHSIAICGMGGSGVPGDMVASLLGHRLGVPIVVSKGYRLPEFCHTDTMVFVVSYSGNTEEVLGMYREAAVRGSRVVAVTSGGELARTAREDGVALVELPGDLPAPRAAVGYLSGALLGVLEATGLGPGIGPDVDHAARVAAAAAQRNGPDAEGSPATDLARRIGARIPVIWGSEGVAATAALRWKTEFNENAKRPAFHASFPELDHNEIEGWSRGSGNGFFLVILRTPDEHPSVAPRVEATLAAIADAGLESEQVQAEGSQALANLLSLIQLGGFVSCYAGLAAGLDPTPIQRIEAMKARLRELA